MTGALPGRNSKLDVWLESTDSMKPARSANDSVTVNILDVPFISAPKAQQQARARDAAAGPTLIEWFRAKQAAAAPGGHTGAGVPSERPRRRRPHAPPSPLLLAIGVKTSVNAFQARQAIRETWWGSLRQHDVLLWFAVGMVPRQPAGAGRANAAERQAELEAALEAEQEEFGDLLLGAEIPVIDSYYRLVQKTAAFLQFAMQCCHGGGGESAATLPSDQQPCFTYVMVLDDDVFVQLDLLLDGLRRPVHDGGPPKTKFYAGQVLASSRVSTRPNTNTRVTRCQYQPLPVGHR